MPGRRGGADRLLATMRRRSVAGPKHGSHGRAHGPPRFPGASRPLAGRSLGALGGFDSAHLSHYRPDGNPRGVTQHGREVAIVEAVRSPIGRGHPQKGTIKDFHPATLLARTYTEVLARGGIDAAPRSGSSVCAAAAWGGHAWPSSTAAAAPFATALRDGSRARLLQRGVNLRATSALGASGGAWAQPRLRRPYWPDPIGRRTASRLPNRQGTPGIGALSAACPDVVKLRICSRFEGVRELRPHD